MIKFIMKDGTKYENDPTEGHNLDTLNEIEEVLDEVGYYILYSNNASPIKLRLADIKEIW